MDQCGSSRSNSSNVLIKDELDISCEGYEGIGEFKIKQESQSSMSISGYNNGHRRNRGLKIKQESNTSVSMPDAEYDGMKEEEDFFIDDNEKGCCVWLKENPTPLLLEEPSVPLLPIGTQIIKVKPVSYTKPLRFQKNNEGTKVSSTLKNLPKKQEKPDESLEKQEKPIKDEFEAIGIVWASKLLRLEETQRVLAEDLINQILKKGFFKDLTTNTTLCDFR